MKSAGAVAGDNGYAVHTVLPDYILILGLKPDLRYAILGGSGFSLT